MILAIGSVALNTYTKLNRTPKDLDVIIDDYSLISALPSYNNSLRHIAGNHFAADDVWGCKHVEFEVTEPGTSALLYLDYYKRQQEHTQLTLPDKVSKVHVAPPEVLYSIKRSHRHFPRFWEKHIGDYHLLKGLVNNEDTLPHITKLRTDNETATLKTPSLNKSTEDFFDDKVSNRFFIHDQIHEIMAHYDRPLFERIKIDPNKVACSKAKFMEMPEEDRNKCVMEEAYVIALERGIIPMLFGGRRYVSSDSAVRWALMRICTTLCSGWFRDYATENYPTLIATYDRDYVAKFLAAVDQGRITQVKKEEAA